MQSFELEGTDEHRQLIPPQHHQHNHNDKNHTFTMEGPPPSATAAINDKPSTTHYKKGSRRIRTGTRIDLAFPTVIITPSNKRRRKKQWGQYRFLAVIALCMTMIFQFFKRIMLPLPTGDKHLDLSRIKSIENLSVDAIDSWCLAEENEESCSCNNPLVPDARHENPKWERVHQMNVAAMEQKGMANLDVVFLGDSITEGWLGQFYHNPDSRVQGAFTIFQSFFSKRTGGKYEGLPQGIAGDTIPELLWRIQHGEVPPYNEWQDRLATTPFPVFWLLIGTNDLGNHGCSQDIVTIGIVRIIMELLQKWPTSIVVINGLLPRTNDHSGYVMQSQGKSPTLWPVIKNINSELEKYATHRRRVEYFETQAFFKEGAFLEKDLRIDPVLMTDYIHPSAAGYRKWGAEIVQKLDEIFADPKNDPNAEESVQSANPDNNQNENKGGP